MAGDLDGERRDAGRGGLEMFEPAFAAIGKLATNWARMETALADAFARMTGHAGANEAPLRRMRWDDAVRRFRRVAAELGADRAALAEFDSIRAEAARVKAIRNVAVHRPLHLQQGDAGGAGIVVFELYGPRKAGEPPEIKLMVADIEHCADTALRLAFRIGEPLVMMLLDPGARPYDRPGLAAVREPAALPTLWSARGRKGAGGP